MKITGIKSQVKNLDRVSIYLDEEYSFSLSKNQLLEFGLAIDQALDDQQLAVLKQLSDFGKLLDRTLRFVAMRPHSKREVIDYLKRKVTELDEQDKLVNYLVERGYINDVEFAKAWVRSRNQIKPTSHRRLLLELKQKGVDQKDIDMALGDEPHNEERALQELITKKRRQLRYQDSQKLMQYLARQGFGYEDIKSALGINLQRD
ncbi:MAG TPA: RecX family transcriptional regulator [Patescibacteria group bacterium]|nr:RecX family transcriptional regulator [Patescibacteria group bacterium]